MTYQEYSGVVAGAGSIGRRHANNLVDLGVKVSLVDPDDEVRKSIENESDFDVYESLHYPLDQELIDFVVVAAPNRFHIDIAIEAAESDCHLFVEKPLSDSMSRINELENLVKQKNLVSLVGCNLRFQPEIKKMRELLNDNVIGNVIAARIEGGSYLPEWFPDTDYTKSYSAREDLGGGVILDYIHEINYARWFFGEFDTIMAMTGQRSKLEIETNDVAAILAESMDNVICEFHFDYIQRSYSRSCHIIGEDGTIRWSWPEERVNWYIANDRDWHSFERSRDWEINEMYVDEIRHFLECIKNHEETICPVDCGRRDLMFALAAQESASSGDRTFISY